MKGRGLGLEPGAWACVLPDLQASHSSEGAKYVCVLRAVTSSMRKTPEFLVGVIGVLSISPRTIRVCILFGIPTGKAPLGRPHICKANFSLLLALSWSADGNRLLILSVYSAPTFSLFACFSTGYIKSILVTEIWCTQKRKMEVVQMLNLIK